MIYKNLEVQIEQIIECIAKFREWNLGLWVHQVNLRGFEKIFSLEFAKLPKHQQIFYLIEFSKLINQIIIETEDDYMLKDTFSLIEKLIDSL